MVDRDDRLSAAKLIPLEEIVDRLGLAGLKRAGREMVGPCPKCGGTDRFSVAPDAGLFNCRSCGGGDGIKLVELVLGCEFPSALAWLVGEQDVSVDPDELARRKRQAAEQEERRAAEARRYRDAAIRRARDIWDSTLDGYRSPVSDYLEARGIRMSWLSGWPKALRFHPDLPYMVKVDGAWVEIYRGAAMVAGIMSPRGAITGVHRTWIDPDKPKGKAAIFHNGEPQDVKKVWGHKKGCAIRLGGGSAPTLVVGEGIETTMTARVAMQMPGMAFWSGIDLGNMAGRRILRGKGMKFAGIPDMSDREAFVPPPWVEKLIFIQDGDSDPKETRAKLESGLRRARALLPRLERTQIVHAGAGRDLNDLLMESIDG